mgnify:CR=1 FL=1
MDGYPICYTTCNEVFYITPEKPAPKPKKVDEEGNEIAEEEEGGEFQPPLDRTELVKLVDFLLGEAEELEALSSGVVTTQSAASDAESEEF